MLGARTDKRICWLHPSPNVRTASFRLRALYPSLTLRKLGWSISFSPKDIATANIVVLSKIENLATIEKVLAERARRGFRLIVDFCDNHFDNHRVGRSATALIRNADVVTCSSATLANIIFDYSRRKDLVVIEDVMDFYSAGFDADTSAAAVLLTVRRRIDRNVRRLQNARGIDTALWFGAAGVTYSEYGGIGDLEDYLLTHAAPDWWVVVSNGIRYWPRLLRFTKAILLPYSMYPIGPCLLPMSSKPATHVLLPIRLNTFTMCKTANRVITSFLLGLPVFGTKIPSYQVFEDLIGPLGGITRDHCIEQLLKIKGSLEKAIAPHLPSIVAHQWIAAFQGEG